MFLAAWVSSNGLLYVNCHKTSNVRRPWKSNKLVDHSDVVGASPVIASPFSICFPWCRRFTRHLSGNHHALISCSFVSKKGVYINLQLLRYCLAVQPPLCAILLSWPVFGWIFHFHAIFRKLNRSQPIIDNMLFSNLHEKNAHIHVLYMRVDFRVEDMITCIVIHHVFHDVQIFRRMILWHYIEQFMKFPPHATIMTPISSLQKSGTKMNMAEWNAQSPGFWIGC